MVEFLVDNSVWRVAADILGNHHLHEHHAAHVVVVQADVVEFFELSFYLLIFELAYLGDFYLGVERRHGVFFFVEHLLVELLAVTEACIGYLHIFGSAELYHAAGEVVDFDGLAHIEHEDFAAFAMGACLEHKFAGFGDEHEVADDTRVGNGERPAILDLLTEQGDDTAIAAEHIAEAGGDETGDALYLACLNGFVETLHVHLADALGTAHHIGGVHGFVGGYHDKLLGAVLHCHIGNDTGAHYIVVNALAGVVFQHGHMLIGGGMEHVVGTVLREYHIHTSFLAYRHDNGLCRDVGVLLCHHEADVVLGCFGLVDEYQLCGLELGYLTYYLAADAACRTSDEHVLSLELVGYKI